MDGQRFDQLVRGFAGSGWSRRGLAWALAGAVAAPFLGWAAPDAAARKKKGPKKKPKKCKNGAVKCGNACVNTGTNALHCGRCGQRCGGNVACVNGECQGGGCAGDRIPCGALCVDPSDDDLHCGGCGIACQGDLTCIGEDCQCAEGAKCGNQCVDTETDDDHCGDCGIECGGGQSCQEGDCVSGETCDPPCASPRTCQDGECVCPGSQVFCFQTGQCIAECCVDGHCVGNANGSHCIGFPPACGCNQLTDWDVRPCGPNGACSLCCNDQECLETLGPGSRCFSTPTFVGGSGACACDRDHGYTDCGAFGCRDLLTDPQSCGICGLRCCNNEAQCNETGVTCLNGNCCVVSGRQCHEGVGPVPCCSGICNRDEELHVCL